MYICKSALIRQCDGSVTGYVGCHNQKALKKGLSLDIYVDKIQGNVSDLWLEINIYDDNTCTVMGLLLNM